MEWHNPMSDRDEGGASPMMAGRAPSHSTGNKAHVTMVGLERRRLTRDIEPSFLYAWYRIVSDYTCILLLILIVEPTLFCCSFYRNWHAYGRLDLEGMSEGNQEVEHK